MLNYTIRKKDIFLITALFMVSILLTFKEESIRILKLIFSVDPLWLGMGVASIVIFWLIEARVFHLMVRTYDKNIRFGEIFKLIITTQFFNGITPFSTGGQPFQILALSKVSQIKLSAATSASIHNFTVYQCVLVFMGFLALIIHNTFDIFPPSVNHLEWISLAGFGLNLLVIGFLIMIAISPTMTKTIAKWVFHGLGKTPFKKRIVGCEQKTFHAIEAFHADILSLMSDKKMLIQSLILNFAKLLIFYCISYFISLAVGLDRISVLQAIVASAYIMLITSIVPLPGGSGGAELGFLVFFGSLVVGAEAKAIMLLWRFITYYLGLILGFLTLNFGYRSQNQTPNIHDPKADTYTIKSS